MARLIRFIVSAIVCADTFPARIVSSTFSANFWKTLAEPCRWAYLLSMNSM